VAVILIGVIAGEAFVKVKKLENEISAFYRDNSDYQRDVHQIIERVEREIDIRNNTLQQHIDTGTSVLHRRIDENAQELERRITDEVREIRQDIDRVEREFQSALDSRLDRLEIKLTTKK
jgi:regulator of replication initiation timing